MLGLRPLASNPLASLVSGASAQALTAGLYSASNSFYAPVVTTRITLTASLFSGGSRFYSVAAGAGVRAGLLANSTQFFFPRTGVGVSPVLITSSAAVYAPSVSSATSVSPSLVGSQAQVFSPEATANNDIAPSLYASASVFYSAAVVRYVLAPLVGSSEQVFAHAAGVGIYAPYLAEPETFFSAEAIPGPVTLEPELTLFDATILPPTVRTQLGAPFLDGTSAIYAPRAGFGLRPELLVSGVEVFSPQLDLTLNAGVFDSTPSFFRGRVRLPSFIYKIRAYSAPAELRVLEEISEPDTAKLPQSESTTMHEQFGGLRVFLGSEGQQGNAERRN